MRFDLGSGGGCQKDKMARMGTLECSKWRLKIHGLDDEDTLGRGKSDFTGYATHSYGEATKCTVWNWVHVGPTLFQGHIWDSGDMDSVKLRRLGNTEPRG